MLNQVSIIGNCGDKPYSGNGVFKFSVATNKRWKDKATGEQRESTQWHNIVTFGNLANICSQYIDKGRQVFVQGEIEYSKYTNQAGQEVPKTSIIAHTVTFLGEKTQIKRDENFEFNQEPSEDIPF